nr:PREDICTED: interleukin-2 receptor subunit alpha-like [Latimeria chalumnae]|eukprot:XP_014346328.1 PREDICTED: interleukin-2 receptor subunit alpha-like [Latimeria chalumnae]
MAHMKTQILITLVVFFQAHQAWSEHCKKPDATKFPNYTIEEYVVGHILQYKCTDGYKRKAGSLSIVECKEGNKETFWNISPMQCFRKDENSEKKIVTVEAQKVKFNATGYCGPPKQFQFMNFISTKFPVGQELHYQCQEGYQNKNGTSCLSTCKYENNAAVWKSQPECISTIQPVVSSTSKGE